MNLLLGRDFGAPTEGRVLVDDQTGRFDVAVQSATRLKLATLGRKNIPLDRAAHFHRLRFDLSFNRSVLADGKSSGRVDRAFNFAVDQELVPKFDRAFNRDSSGKESAGMR